MKHFKHGLKLKKEQRMPFLFEYTFLNLFLTLDFTHFVSLNGIVNLNVVEVLD